MSASHGDCDSPLRVTLRRDGDRLWWRVENVSPAPVWAFLLVPTVIDGAYSFAVDAAWLEMEGDRLLIRKVDTPVPAGRRTDRVNTGAVELPPGAVREGAVALADEVAPRAAYAPRSRRHHRVRTVVMEVGWLPAPPEQQVRSLSWKGQPFAYLYSELEPGGQRFARSAPLAWEEVDVAWHGFELKLPPPWRWAEALSPEGIALRNDDAGTILFLLEPQTAEGTLAEQLGRLVATGRGTGPRDDETPVAIAGGGTSAVALEEVVPGEGAPQSRWFVMVQGARRLPLILMGSQPPGEPMRRALEEILAGLRQAPGHDAPFSAWAH